MTTQHMDEPTSEKHDGRREERKPLRFTCWSRIKLDLPDAPEHILDDIFWHGSSNPETVRYLEECGFKGVLWP